MKKTNKPNPLKVFNDNKAMAYKKAGGEMAAYKKSLNKLRNGGPGSGMGRMAADDAAFDAMMNPPTKPASPYPSPETARLLAAKAAEAQNTWMNNNANSQNVNLANQARLVNMNIPTNNTRLENYGINPYKNKKGGSVGRKRK